LVNKFKCGHVDIEEKDLIDSPQPYTVSDLRLLWAIYRHTVSGKVSNDPLYFLTDDPTYFSHRESPDLGIHPEFDPDIYKQAVYDVIFSLKYRHIYDTSPNVLKYFKTAAYLMYVLPYKEVQQHINRNIYWEIAVWRMKIQK